MTSLPAPDELALTTWLLALGAAFIQGLSKSGIKGTAVLSVTLMALALGARQSTGLLVPLLIFGDVFAVIYYHRHAQWNYIWKFLPWMILGILIGVWTGKDLPESVFKWAMAAIILGSVGIMAWWDLRKSERVPKHWAFAGFIGSLAGFTTMVGNLAGAFSNIYFLAMRLPKNAFIGTAAWLFLIINVFKLPFHIFVWKTIDLRVLHVNLWLLPALILGLLFGIWLVKRIREGIFRRLILILTALGAVLMLLR
ncbi:sulfite exporter TauE/SafE family protein [Robiginitalea sp. M366]|uniref:sulfite exporter TauE/SafE family protein n=1 Tax=Robiginitalea aestuariiviva TaxID=3036903 RepID=UPI00240DB8DA|nr:sulfite exporter TauE/SafE family protein [Robiginitalea aestuariiviva]MDG1571566.1 sulfite exporter TauE/SafE family protein [Robiginitalea aestuariiviva]